jgi:CubicO group peptidase (beta-lactamase class C family)
VISYVRSPFIWFLLIGAFSCAPFRSKEPVQLPVRSGRNSLDSLQAHSIFKYTQHFPNETELAIAFITGDSDEYFGIKRRNDSLVYVDNSKSIFEIGSITKTFTATILAKLVYDGKVDLNEPIKNILPVQLHQSALNGKEVTLLHLANHTSGFPKEPDNISTDWTIPGSPYQSYDETKLYEFLSGRLTLQSTPGEKREYSNLGGGLLGHLLTLVTGKPYETLLMEYICKPLGLYRTFVALDAERTRYLVPGRDPQGNVVPNWELNVLAGGGGIKSTAEDIAKYLRAHMTDTTYYLLTQQPTIKYTEHNSAGLGWTWYEDGSRKFVSATGGTGGYSCCVIFERSTRTGIVLLTNVSAFLASKGDYISKLGIELGNSLSRADQRK